MTINKAQYTRSCRRYKEILRKKPRSPKLNHLFSIIIQCIEQGVSQGRDWAFIAQEEWK